MRKVGAAPRTDVTKDILPLLGEEVELIQAGGLDGLTREEIQAFAPGPDDYVLISRLQDGSSVIFAERFILPRLQNCIDKLEEQGVEIVSLYRRFSGCISLQSSPNLPLQGTQRPGARLGEPGQNRSHHPHASASGPVRSQVEGVRLRNHRHPCLSLRKCRGAGPGGPKGGGIGRGLGSDGLHRI